MALTFLAPPARITYLSGDYDSVTPRELVTQAPDQRLRFQSPSLEGGSGLPKIGFKLRYSQYRCSVSESC